MFKGMHSDEGCEDPGDRVEWGSGNRLLDHPSRSHRMDETASLSQCKSLKTLSRMSRQGIDELPRKRGPDRRRLIAPLPLLFVPSLILEELRAVVRNRL